MLIKQYRGNYIAHNIDYDFTKLRNYFDIHIQLF